MVNIHLFCVDKLKEKHFAAACAEYEKRLGAFCKLTITELPEERLPDNPSQAQIDAALEKEAANLFQNSPRGPNSLPCVWRASSSPARPWPPRWKNGR